MNVPLLALSVRLRFFPTPCSQTNNGIDGGSDAAAAIKHADTTSAAAPEAARNIDNSALALAKQLDSKYELATRRKHSTPHSVMIPCMV